MYNGHFACECYHPLFVLTVWRSPAARKADRQVHCRARQRLSMVVSYASPNQDVVDGKGRHESCRQRK